MKRKQKNIIILFIITSVLMSIAMIMITAKAENDADTHRRSRLSYLSSMMKKLAIELESNEEEKARYSASVIRSSGDLGYLDKIQRERVSHFLWLVTEGRVECCARSAAYARQCSACALNSIIGKDYQLAEYDNIGDEKTVSRYNFKSTVNFVKKLTGKDVRLTSYLSGEYVSSARSNVYFLTMVDANYITEHVYLKSTSEKEQTFICSTDKAVNKAVGFMEQRGRSVGNAQFIFFDLGTAYVKCEIDEYEVIIGIRCMDGEVSHFKKV